MKTKYSNNMDLNELQEFLQTSEIPEIKSKPKTFLGIAKQPHYENVLSNIYAFYFNVNEVHGLKDLFISTFLEVIKEKTKESESSIIFNNNFSIKTEYYTVNKGRIDLLLYDEVNAIIIENKVYHFLGNDLIDYWDSIKVEDKIGVVLSLKIIPNTGHEHFINITHMEFLESVMINLNGYRKEVSPKYLIFLEDLYQNIINLSTSVMEKKDLEFYKKNQQKINALKAFELNVRSSIIGEIENVCESFSENFSVDKKGSNSFCFLHSKKYNNLVLLVLFKDLFDPIESCFELKIKLLNNQIDQVLTLDIDLTDEERDTIYKDEKTWGNYASQKFKVDDFTNIGDIVAGEIQNSHTRNVFSKLENILSKDPTTAAK
ncbi:PD-(D/E)XK nuclease family protein [Labilibaculum sp.]|uniref:PD-(D/E)XK nuclease family protein n=1 Tax=Labilibaculum sp. TaxID=2060723 RepID=UPI00356136F8